MLRLRLAAKQVDIELDTGESSPDASPTAKRMNIHKDKSNEEIGDGEQFVRRRLSIAQQLDFEEEEVNA